jgi:hypothetical protein
MARPALRIRRGVGGGGKQGNEGFGESSMSGDSNLVIIVKAEAAGSAALRVVHEQYLIKLRDWGWNE